MLQELIIKKVRDKLMDRTCRGIYEIHKAELAPNKIRY